LFFVSKDAEKADRELQYQNRASLSVHSGSDLLLVTLALSIIKDFLLST
jgi:zona occludens toxin (predicted ATPase)